MDRYLVKSVPSGGYNGLLLMMKNDTMKIAQRVGALLAAVILFAFSAASCQFPGGGTQGKDFAKPSDNHVGALRYESTLVPNEGVDLLSSTPTAYLNELNTPKYNGREIRIAAYDPSYIFTSENTDTLHRAVNDRNALAEQKLDAVITRVNIEPSEFFDTISNQYNAGISICDMLIMPYSLLPAFMANDMLMNAASLRYTDYSKPYFDQKAMNSISPGRMIYGVAGDLTFAPDKYWCTFYNADLLASLGLQDPKELYDQYKWDWETVIKYGKTAASKEGLTPITSEGSDTVFSDVIWASSGISLIQNDRPYAPQMVYDTDSAKGLIKFISKMFDDLTLFLSEDETLLGARELFKEGNTLFYFARSSEITQLSSSVKSLGILPLPSYGQGRKSYSYVDSDSQAVFFLNDITDSDLSGAAIQVLSAASAGRMKKAYTDMCMNYYLRDNNDARRFSDIFDNAYYDLGYMLGPSVTDIASASIDIIHNTIFMDLDFKSLYKQSIVAFNERYSHRDFFTVEKESE